MPGALLCEGLVDRLAKRASVSSTEVWWTFPELASAPHDLVITRGKDINSGWVIPSLDLVFVRLGDGQPFPKDFEKDLVLKVLAAIE